MSDKAREFVEQWVSDNIHPTGYEPEGDASEAKTQALVCLAAADQAGISRGEISSACGDLVEYMAAAIESANDREVQRLIAKDD